MENFCHGDKVWDVSQFWNTSTPIFNRCFQRSIPIIVPAIFLWPLAFFSICRNLSRSPPRLSTTAIPPNLYNVSRQLAVAAIILVSVVQFIFDLWHYIVPDPFHQPSPADLTGSLVNALTWTLFAFLLHLHRLYGFHTSSLAWLFTFLSFTLALPTVYMYARFYGNDAILRDIFKSGVNSWSPVDMALFAAHFGLVLFVFLLTCFADVKPVTSDAKKNDIDSNGQLKPLIDRQDSTEATLVECPESSASFLSFITFWWFNSLAITGFKKTLTLGDLWALKEEDTTQFIAPRFDRAWTSQVKFTPEEVALYAKTAASNGAPAIEMLSSNGLAVAFSSQKKKGKVQQHPGTVTTLLKTFGWSFALGVLYKLAHDLLMFVNPQLLKVFITFISTPSSPTWHGFVLAALFFLTATVQSLIINVYFHLMYSTGMRIRTALTSAIYRKSLTLSNAARRTTTTGAIQNLMSVDISKIADLLTYINLIWSAPLQVLLTMYFLWAELGPSVIAGALVLVGMIPLNGWISTVQQRKQKEQMIQKDERIKVISEILNGIRVLKLYAWEMPFAGIVSGVRKNEIKQLEKIGAINAFMSIMWTCSPFFVSLVTFGVYVLSSPENVLDAQKAFVSLSLFELLRFPLTMFPDFLTQVAMARVALGRIDKFLNAEQLEGYVSRDEDETVSVKIENGFFAWSNNSDNGNKEEEKDQEVEEDKLIDISESPSPKVTLSGVDLKVPKGSLVAVVGRVGSAKSSLLSAILGDMDRIEGRVNVANGEFVAYVAQQAWIRNATLRENILFGAKYEEARYRRVLDICALKPDLAILPGGDQVEIGEKGINLSGGQKQRVAVARACYSSANLFLLDDPLSAVDSHVAKHLFEKVFSSTTGYLRRKTRIIVTNNISILPEVDQIVVMSGGSISERGTYDELMSRQGPFAEFIQEHANQESQDEDQAEEGLETEEGSDAMRERKRTISSSASMEKSAGSRSGTLETSKQQVEKEKQLIEEERSASGNVKWSVYLDYFRSLTLLWIALTLIGYVGMQVASVGTNVWLAVWSSDRPVLVIGVNGSNTIVVDTDQRNYRLAVYGCFGLVQGLFFFVGAISLVKGTVNSSVTLHRTLLERIMHAPLSFFDTTPLGRIVNRFSKDVDTVDSHIPQAMDGWLICFLQVVATLVLISVEVPVFMAVIVPILLLYLFIQKFYVATSRQLKRLESVTRSPVYSHFGETLFGVSTIRAFSATGRFVAESSARVDRHQRCYFAGFIANRWLSLRLELCGNLIIIAVACFTVWSRENFAQSPGFVGLLLNYSLSVTQMLNWLVRMTSEMETNVVAVERISEYAQLKTEAEWRRPLNERPKVEPEWPQAGVIKFERYSVRYREGLDMVLKEVSLEVGAGEKVGIVGRTGSGKSTLTLSLFRILEPAAGSITIDGVDISQIGLHELRNSLAIIPQDPVLFSGTIRSNLDPFSAYSDSKLWLALEHCHLKDFISKQTEGLDYPIAESGSNLSVGERQLLCLGRALLKNSKILVLDEATAAVDLETDALIQTTIKSEFASHTVITIAHRLNTILDADRVLVLEQGKVVEFNSPQHLLADRRSKFYALAKDAKLV